MGTYQQKNTRRVGRVKSNMDEQRTRTGERKWWLTRRALVQRKSQRKKRIRRPTVSGGATQQVSGVESRTSVMEETPPVTDIAAGNRRYHR